MKQTIENLWNGNIRPYQLCTAGDAEIEELRGYIKRHRAELEKSMDERQKKIFANYLACAEEQLYLIAVSAFGEGFTLATKLMAEVMA